MAVFPVVLDANVLFGILPADLLVTAAGHDLFRVHWSDEIIDEARRNVLAKRTTIDPARVRRRFDLMNEAMPSATANPPQEIIDAMTNDPKDRHVLATAVHVGAEVIVTENVSDFPEAACLPHNVEIQTLDQFVSHLVTLNPEEVLASVDEMADRRRRPPNTQAALLELLEEKYLPTAIPRLRATID